MVEVWTCPNMYSYLHFIHIMRLAPLDFKEITWLNSYIFMSLCGYISQRERKEMNSLPF